MGASNLTPEQRLQLVVDYLECEKAIQESKAAEAKAKGSSGVIAAAARIALCEQLLNLVRVG